MSPINREASPAPLQDSDAAGQGRNAPPLVFVSIKDPLVLQRCYLPFFQRGGLFVPGTRPYRLRQRVFLILKLPAVPGEPDAETVHALNATVAWLTPAQAQGDSGMGYGLHFDNMNQPGRDLKQPGRDLKQPERNLRESIESLLTALL